MDGADWWMGGRCGVRKPGRGGLGRTGGLADAADYGILDGAVRADWGGRGGWGRIRSSLEGRKGRTGKPGAGVTAD